MKRIIKTGLWSICLMAVICIALLLTCNQIVVHNAKGKVFSELDSIAPTEWGLLLGTTPQTRIGNRQNLFFKYRIEAAEQLYKTGKIKRILISGDDDSLDGINEVVCMRDSLVARGVNAKDIVLDGYGFRTLDAVVRTVKVYDIHGFVSISQRFHNERALYLAEHYGLDVHDIYGFNANDATSGKAFLTYIREYFARVKVFIDLLAKKEPSTYEPYDNNLCDSRSGKPVKTATDEVNTEELVTEQKEPVTILRKDTLGLIVLYPQFSTIDLVCGTIPSKSDSSVILFAEAAYTGELLKEFKHSNVAGDHVSQGKRHKGYRCVRNTGAFVYYNGELKFCYKDYSQEMDKAAANSGAAFGQEMIIHKGKLVEIARKDNNKNQFRALCNHDGKLCIAESKEIVPFGDFKKQLLALGVSDAIYLDMGPGWNHAWYRDKDEIVELHPRLHNFCTNWITFYK